MDEHDPRFPLPPGYGQYKVYPPPNGNAAANKIVWWVAASLTTLYLTLMTGAMAWLVAIIWELQIQVTTQGVAIATIQNQQRP